MATIFKLLTSEPRIVLDRLYYPPNHDGSGVYSPSWVCQAIFQSLSPVAQCLVMRLIFLESSFTGKDISIILCNATHLIISQAMEELQSLWVIVEEGGQETEGMGDLVDLTDSSSPPLAINENQKFIINPKFRAGFKSSMVQPQEPWVVAGRPSMNTNTTAAANGTLQVEQLERHSQECWNRLLSMLVNVSPSQPTAVSAEKYMEKYVLRAGLMVPNPSSSSISSSAPNSFTIAFLREQTKAPAYLITSRGYEFMLKDYRSQVWEYVQDVLKHCPGREECYQLLFMLAYCQYGRGYAMEALTKIQKQIIFEFSQVGLVMMKGSSIFYPCRISSEMLFPQQISSSSITNSHQSATTGMARVDGTSQLEIIVETNLQVIAYVTSDLHLAMLRLFVDVNIRLPNMAMGRLTREKSREAFRSGITAAQIIDFLTVHAHPVTRKKQTTVIPENVSDQLVLWEAETKRIQTTDAIVADFREMTAMNQSLFNTLVENLKSAKYLLWCHPDRMIIACKPEAEASIHDYLMNHVLYIY
eukprot:gene1598-1745_t